LSVSGAVGIQNGEGAQKKIMFVCVPLVLFWLLAMDQPPVGVSITPTHFVFSVNTVITKNQNVTTETIPRHIHNTILAWNQKQQQAGQPDLIFDSSLCYLAFLFLLGKK
jgi:hypothetical protein